MSRTPVLGQRVNNFRIARLLGEGGMGTVYEAEHLLIRRKVAVKVLRPELLATFELVQRFFNEARATSAIKHPNIVEVLDVGRMHDGVPYLVMELLEGESLGDRLDRVQQLPVDEAIDVARQAANGLEAAHGKSIVHRDLKPDNLFLVSDARIAGRELVKVLDFGIAKLRGDPAASSVETVAGALFGTPPYMSPEQCRGVSSEIDQRTDIYALGIIFYEMLCGRPPFEAEGMGDMMMLHMTAVPVPPSRLRPDIPSRVERAILKALAKRREDRFATMAEFGAALAECAPLVTLAEVAAPLEPLRVMPAVAVSATATTARVPAADAPAQVTPEARNRAQPDSLAIEAERTSSRVGRGFALGLLAVAAIATFAWLRATPHAGADLAGHVAQTPPEVAARVPAAAYPVVAAPAQAAESVAAPVVGSIDSNLGSAARHASNAHAAPSSGKSKHPGSERADAHAAGESSAAGTVAGAHALAMQDTGAAPKVLDGDTSVTHDGHDAALAKLAPRPTASGDAAAAAQRGYLSLDSAPWSNVFLGGKLLGTTPLVRVPLAPGKYVLTLQNPELGKSTSYVVEIQSGNTLSRMVGWE